MRYSIPTLIVLALLVSTLGGCQGTKTASGTAASDGFPSPDKEYVYQIAAQALRDQGMEPDSESSSLQTFTIVSHWKLSMQPFSGNGYRQRATVKILDVPGRCGYYFTETQVVRQINDNLCEPSSVMAADWGDEGRCAELEGLINRRIELHFLPGEVSQSFRNRYGIEDDGRRIDCNQIERQPEEPQQVDPSGGAAPWTPYGG